MDENAKRKRSIAVTLFLSCLFLIASFGLQVQTKNTLNALAAVSVTAQQTVHINTTAVQLTAPLSVPETEAVIAQIENTEPVSEKVTAAKQTNTTKSTKETTQTPTEKNTEISQILIVNTNTKKIHSPDCSYAQNIKAENRAQISRDELSAYEQNGYTLCGHCKGCAK
ncbi:MAG: hypothetical protein ACI4LB_05160 [Candidatus Fimenecus sp.]